MGDATRNLSQRQEMDKWLAKLSPELKDTFAKMYKSFENAEVAGGETEAGMDAAEDNLIQTARSIVEANEKAAAGAGGSAGTSREGGGALPGLPAELPVTADGPVNAGPAKAGDDKDEVKIEVSDPGVDPAKVKAVVQQMLKLLDKELSSPASKKRIIAAMASKGKFSPSGGIDPYSEIDAEESVTLDVWSELVEKSEQEPKQPLPTVWEADKAGRAVIRARFERRRRELEKTVPRSGLQRLQHERTRVDQLIAQGKQRLAALAKQLAEQEALLARLDQSDGRTEDEKRGNEPRRKPWAKMDEAKKRIESLKGDIKYERDLVEKDLPKKAREVDDQIVKEEGTLCFEITAVTDMKAANPQFTLGDDTDKQWKLKLPSSEKEPQGRAKALKDSVKFPWKIPLPRKVRLDIYHLRNKRKDRMCGGWMVFKKGNTGTKPDSYEDLVGSYEGWEITKSINEWIDLAWSNNTVQAAATANVEIEGTTS